MRFPDVYVAGVAASYPKAVQVDEAVADGRYHAALHRRTRQQRVAILADGESAPELAVAAGRCALRRSGHHADECSLLLHAVATNNGLEGWNAASYLQHEVLTGAGVAFEVRQLSNGAVACIELAVTHLQATGGVAALITAADQFDLPTWNRWTANPGLVFGDGASAIVLSLRSGFARLLSCATVCDAALEGVQRGNRPLRWEPEKTPVSLFDRTLEFSDQIPLGEVTERMAAGLRAAGDRVAAEAGVPLADFDHYVTPNFGWDLLHQQCLGPLGLDATRTTWAWGSEIGHAGTTDQFGGLHHLAQSGRLEPGQRVLLISIGGGFNWTCVALEVVAQPAWDTLPV
ncbi:MAG: ketoacyl-ACP synthase III family protein [Micromonosporaceae bacterium]|nr:ketoacyl-ACP synthase III family protein [Micromonosporaceae bacterium]